MKRILFILILMPIFAKSQYLIKAITIPGNDTLWTNVANDSVWTGNTGSLIFAYKPPYKFSSFQPTLSVGTNLSTSPLTVTNFNSTFTSPQTGTILHVVSSGVSVNPRISMDAYNGSNANGSVFQGRRAAGSAASPTAALVDYTLAGLVGDGYGATGFHNISVGGVLIKSAGTMTDASAPTYISFMTTPTASTTAAERMKINADGTITGISSITATTFIGALTGTASGNLVSGGALGTPSSGTATNITGLPVSTGISGLGTGVATALAINTGSAGAVMLLNGAGGTPSSLVGTNITGTASGLTAGNATTLATGRNINGVSFNGSADIQTDLTIAAYLAGGSPWLAQTMDVPFIIAQTSTALVDNTVRFVPVYLPKSATLTGIRVYVRTLGNYTGDNNNRVGLYSYSGGTMTLVASSTNSSSLWTSAANAFQTIPFTSTYAANAGLYFVGLLYNQSAQTTAPTLAGAAAFNNVAMVTYQGTNSIKFFGTLGSSNDLPSSQAMSGVTGVTASYWVALY